jgi:hypothetical protein
VTVLKCNRTGILRTTMGNLLLFPVAEARSGSPIACRPRLGGLLKYYHRPAA